MRKLKIISSSSILLLVAAILSACLYILAMPPREISQAAFVFAIPLLTAGLFSWPRRTYGLIVFISIWFAWAYNLYWLRHITWVGTGLLSATVALLTAPWFLWARSYLKPLLYANTAERLLGFISLAGGWVVLEWIRGVLFGGFPWLPLAASQAHQPVLLTILPLTGTAGLSFFIIFFNLALISYGWRLGRQIKANRRFIVCPEIYLALAGFIGLGFLFFKNSSSTRREVHAFTAGVVQPYTPAVLKWSPNSAQEQCAILSQLTHKVGREDVDVVLWPEASTPAGVVGYPPMRHWVEALSHAVQKPIWMGNLAYEGDCCANGLFIVDPDSGLHPQYYSKRALVPFGEYVPAWARIGLPWLKKVVPLPGDTQPGQLSDPLIVHVNDQAFQLGCLICYEDIFPELARTTVLAGADFFLVVTNNAWYGEEGAAEQHFAHSILRAAETQRPFIRAGNAGQSGWIDAQGRIRQVLGTPENGPYFRGTGILRIDLDPQLQKTQTPYVRYGEWLTLILAILASVLTLTHLKKQRNDLNE